MILKAKIQKKIKMKFWFKILENQRKQQSSRTAWQDRKKSAVIVHSKNIHISNKFQYLYWWLIASISSFYEDDAWVS